MPAAGSCLTRLSHGCGRCGVQAKIEKYAFPPAADTLVFVCGLPPMYAALCGPREDKLLQPGTVLEVLGYSSEMVLKL